MCWSTMTARSGSTGRAIRATRPTDRGAPTPRPLAALLARGMELPQAARWAREIAAEAVGHGLSELGAGPGPVDVLGVRRREIDPPRLDP